MELDIVFVSGSTSLHPTPQHTDSVLEGSILELEGEKHHEMIASTCCGKDSPVFGFTLDGFHCFFPSL